MFAVVLYRKWGAGPFRIWNPGEGVEALFAEGVLAQRQAAGTGSGEPDRGEGGMERPDRSGRAEPSPTAAAGLGGSAPDFNGGCGDYDHSRKIAAGIAWVISQGLRWEFLEARLTLQPEGPGSSGSPPSTPTPPTCRTMPRPCRARWRSLLPGRWQSRTVLQGLVSVPAEAAGPAALGEARSYNLLLTGEVLRGGTLFDSFRYRFTWRPATLPPRSLLAFERPLRPGEYTLVVKVEDVNSGKLFREERALTVPEVSNALPAAAAPKDPEAAKETIPSTGRGQRRPA